MKNSDHHKISHTAVFCARSLAKETTIPYTKEIYESLLEYNVALVKDGNNWLNNLMRKILFIFPKMSLARTQLEGRYLSVNNALEKNRNPYVLEIAAGLSPRGLKFTEDKKRLFIESDLPELIKIKKEIVEKISAKRDNYHIISLNVLNKKDLEKAGRIYKKSDKKKPLAIIHSGLFMYLSRKEQEKMRDNISEFLKKYCPKGMWITTDFSLDIKKYLKNPLVKWRMRSIEKKTGRKFSFFNNDEEIKSFMKEGKFKINIIKGSEITKKLSIIKKLNINQKKAKEGSFMYDCYVMKLG